MGVVKNRCKNGDHYWVDAFITPVFQNGQVIGCESVRVPPKARWKQRVEQLCAKVRAGKFKRRWPSRPDLIELAAKLRDLIRRFQG